ncbi:NRDE-2, necessary for RNA interference-domain-containing protein [Mariannaea sp. PMI_226]|nr:NRDE-2, necessary for RNA interference-domain-containing protein [Mariannaea sp. PMI_226]
MSTNNETPELPVPKFASFKAKEKLPEKRAPKFSSFKPREPEKRRASEEDRDQDSRSKRSRHSESRHSDRRERSRSHLHDSNRRSRGGSPPSSRPKTPDHARQAVKPTRDENAVSKPYAIDLKGDPLILRYGSSDKSQVPAYWRYGSGRVLGTAGRLVIHRDGPRDQFSLRMPGEGLYAFRDLDGLRTKAWRVTSNPRRVRVKGLDTQTDEVEDFLPLRSSKTRKRGQDDLKSSDEDEQPNYRSIEGKAKARAFLDSDSDSSTESESESPIEVAGGERGNHLKWKSIQLSRQVKDHPEDIDAWIELANHQDDLLRAGEDIDRKALDSELHSYAEIKLSMLESALSNVTCSKDRLRVLVPLMREGVKVWNHKTAARKWADLRKDEEASFALWRAHLDFAMSDIASFHYDDIKKMHLDRLHQVLQQQGSASPEKIFSEAIYIFLRLSRFIHGSGYKELAMAAWQAILELNVFRPTHVNDDTKTLSEFSDFWESEVLRIGEPGAKGWAESPLDSGELGDPAEPLHVKDEPMTQSRDEYKAWGNAEYSHAKKASIPARTMDEGNDDDPFRVVMFSDLEQLLFVIPRLVLQGLIPQLLDAFLIFLRLPPAFGLSDWTEDACNDQFLAGPSPVAELQSHEKPSEVDPLSEEIQRRSPSFEQIGYHAAASVNELFPVKSWFRRVSPKVKDGHNELEFVINATRQLVLVAKIESLGQYYLSLCAVRDAAAVRKPAKALLKQYPANFKLYGAYACAEFANDNFDVGTKVLASATELASRSSGSDSFLLWRIWSLMEFELGHKDLAIRRLCSSTDEALRSKTENVELSQTHLLKAERAFSSNIMQCFSTGNLEDVAIYVECLGLLTYLTADACTEPTSVAQGNISSAMAAFQVQSAEFKARGYEKSKAHEQTLQFAAKILYMNATLGPFRRAYMLDQLSRFITLFPRNTVFLGLYEWADSSLRVIDEVRTLLYEKVLVVGQDGVGSRLFAIQHEMQRGNVNTTKAAFEEAMRSDVCKSSVPLWKLFIKFCSSHKETRPKAKDVLFRAMRHCPWSKAVMMEAFLTVNRDMESTELRGVFDTMTSKGLRIHVDLDEFLEKRRRERRANKGQR